MQAADPLKLRLLRCWPAMGWAGVQLWVALVGFPLRPEAPLRHWLLAYTVVACVIAAMIFCGLLPRRNARVALLSVAGSITFLLNVSACDTLIGGDEASFSFMAGLFALQSQMVRALLVLLFAILVTLLTTTCHQVLRLGDALTVSHGEGVVQNGLPSQATKAAVVGQTLPKPRHAGQARTASASKGTVGPAEPGSAFDGPEAGVHSGGRRQTSSYEAQAASRALAVDPWRASHIALSALPLLAFLWVGIAPIGSPGPHPAHEKATLGSVTEQAPTASTATPQAHPEAPPPRASVQSPPSGADRTKRAGGRRPEIGARVPP